MPNVTTEVNSTILGILMFLHVGPLLHKARSATTCHVWDLPILQRNMRSMFLWNRMKNVYGDTRKLKMRLEQSGFTRMVDSAQLYPMYYRRHYSPGM
jgi:hypothetical protein